MAALALATVMKCLPQPTLIYETSCSDSNFSFPSISNSEAREDSLWWTIDVPFAVPQSGTQFSMAASGASVGTASPCVNSGNDYVAAADAMARLDAIVDAITGARPLPCSPALDDLLARAVQSQGKPQNVREWARRLAESVGDLED